MKRYSTAFALLIAFLPSVALGANTQACRSAEQKAARTESLTESQAARDIRKIDEEERTIRRAVEKRADAAETKNLLKLQREAKISSRKSRASSQSEIRAIARFNGMVTTAIGQRNVALEKVETTHALSVHRLFEEKKNVVRASLAEFKNQKKAAVSGLQSRCTASESPRTESGLANEKISAARSRYLENLSNLEYIDEKVAERTAIAKREIEAIEDQFSDIVALAKADVAVATDR